MAPGRRLGVWAVVGSMHLMAVWALALSTSISRPPPFLKAIAVTLVQTNNPARRSADLVPLVTQALVLQDPAESVLSLPSPPIFEIVESNAAAISTAPQILDTAQPDMAFFARQAALLPGESAVVVLRIEILPDGKVGHVQVDVSSGSWQVDEAAIAYARTQTWVPGRIQGIEESTWVRYGVRLAA